MRVEPTSPHSPLAEELARCLRVLERRAEYAPADVDTYLVALVLAGTGDDQQKG